MTDRKQSFSSPGGTQNTFGYPCLTKWCKKGSDNVCLACESFWSDGDGFSRHDRSMVACGDCDSCNAGVVCLFYPSSDSISSTLKIFRTIKALRKS